MHITATGIQIRWRTFAVVMGVVALSASTLMAQLRFSGPRNQAAQPDTRANPFRTDESIRQAQFRPADANLAEGTRERPQALKPLVPAPDKETKLGAGTVTPSRGGLTPIPASGEGESIPPGTVMQEIPGADEGTILENTWDDPWGDGLSTELMQQDQPLFYSTNNWFRRGYWYSQVEVVTLLRTESHDVVISADNTGAGLNVSDLNAPILSSKSADPTYTPGARLTLGRLLGQDVANRDYSVEFAFLGLFDYSEEATLIALSPNGLIDGLGPGNHYFTTGVTGVMVGAATPGYGDAHQHDIRYDSDFNSFELNFRVMGRPLRDRIDLQPNGSWVRNGSASHLRSVLFGLRAISVNEFFRLKSSFVNSDTSGDYRVRTANDMFGVQLGGEFVENFNNWSWGGRFKAGGLFNFADRHSTSRVRFSGVQLDPRDQLIDSENLAALVEAGVMATYQIRANLVARIAYDAMYLTGIATAPENLGLGDAFPNFEVTGDSVYHGLSVGFEMLW